MTWELASFAIVALALGGGFVWWERHRPSSRVLALVATLAALAALGRVAFAPVPNVKPTTDIALLSGYVLGGAPGFAVGAIGALASNLVFGQGPWTPWQMAAWGLCGIGGAGLARVAGRDVGRLGLAAACGAAGLVYGVILDYSDWVTFSGTHTLEQYLVRSGASLPFNVAHAVGNVVFCLLFGPAFVRALRRFRARLDVTWTAPAPPAATAAALLAALVLAACMLASSPARAQASTTSRAAAYLVRAQNADGGLGAAPRLGSSGLYSSWAAIGLAAAHRDPDRVRRGGRSLGAYVAGLAGRVRGAGDVERTILALRAAGRPAGALRRRMHRGQRRDGSWDGLVNLTAFGVLAVRAAGDGSRSGPVRRAAAFLARAQHRDGGFGVVGRGGPSDVDVTGAVLQALVAAGRPRSSGPVARAARFLAARQNADGGFGQGGGARSNAQSTAFAVQGLLAAGRRPGRLHRRGARSPVAYLRSLQSASGAVRYSRTSGQTPVWVTAQALAALAGRPLPVRGR